jgi:hypothetical protein
MAKKVEITLTVEASSLYDKNNPSRSEVDSLCQLKDGDHESSPGAKIEDFTSQVYIGHDVKWIGETKDPTEVDKGYSVAILSVAYQSRIDDVNFFTTTAVCGTGGRSGNVTAQVKNDPNLVSKLDVYSINFSVTPQGNGVPKVFYIDPKLQGNA